MNHLPAVFGHQPLFGKPVHIARPLLPKLSELSVDLGKCLDEAILCKGPQHELLEREVAEYLGVRNAIAVSNCTSGLMLAYRALDLTGEAVVPSFTFMATTSALVWTGVRPAFADIDSGTTNLDPSAVEAAITRETSAIIAIHNSGNPADIDALQRIATRHSLCLIFDAAHAFGSSYQQTPVGAQGDVQIFSLSPTKVLAAGEGGIVATNDDVLARRIRVGREYGNRGDYDSEIPGLNARLPEFNALLGRHSLRKLDAAVLHRNEIARMYRQRLAQLPGISFQEVREGNISCYKDFSIMIDVAAFGLSRVELAAVLSAENIETRTYFDPPVHRQIAYRQYAPPAGTLCKTESLSESILNLPIWSDMDLGIASDICLAIEAAHADSESIRRRLRQAATA
jgi:dTDP-4-amino-4,6-dideoxygalactose transaminase